MKNMTRNYNGELDILKFVFAFIIVVFHFFHFRSGTISLSGYAIFPLGRPFPSGYMPVEFFYLVSGALMARNVLKKENTCESTVHIGEETCTFVLHKFISVYAYYIASVILNIILVLYLMKELQFIPQGLSGLDYIWELLLVNMSGLGQPYMLNDPIWYISAMLLSMMFVYPLLRKNSDVFLNIIAPIYVLFVMGYISVSFGHLCINYSSFQFVYPGILRASAELSLGVLCYYYSQKLAHIDLNDIGRILLTIIEVLLYSLAILLMNSSFWSKTDFITLLLLSIAVTITFSMKTIWSRFFTNRLSFLLGKISMSWFLCHYVFNKILLLDSFGLSNKMQFCVYILVTFSVAIICLFAGRIISQMFSGLISYIKKNLVKGVRIGNE